MKIKKTKIVYYPTICDQEDFYCSDDIDIAATLMCRGYELFDVTGNVFVFRYHPQIKMLVNDIRDGGVTVSTRTYENARKKLKYHANAVKR